MNIDLIGLAQLLTALGVVWTVYEARNARKEATAAKELTKINSDNIQKIETATNSLVAKVEEAARLKGREEMRVEALP